MIMFQTNLYMHKQKIVKRSELNYYIFMDIPKFVSSSYKIQMY